MFARIYKYRCYKLGYKIGFSTIPLNVFGPGLRIAHPFNIAVHPKTTIGKNCILFQGVTIGSNNTNSTEEAAIIGDNVVICAGAKIIGKVKIASNVVIGANAVVVKDITEPNTTWGGIIARKISNKSSAAFYSKEFLN